MDCNAITERKILTAVLRAAGGSPPCPLDGSEAQMVEAFDVLAGVVAEYRVGGDQLIEGCSCGAHLGQGYGIRMHGHGSMVIEPPEWLVSFNPDLHAPGVPCPTGRAEFDIDPGLAMRFATAADAMTYVCTQSTATPLRPDGKPNQPLLAFTVSIEPIPDDGSDPDPLSKTDEPTSAVFAE